MSSRNGDRTHGVLFFFFSSRLGQFHFGDLRVVSKLLSTLPAAVDQKHRPHLGAWASWRLWDLLRQSLHLNTILMRFRSKLESEGRCLKMLRSAHASPDVRAVALACGYVILPAFPGASLSSGHVNMHFPPAASLPTSGCIPGWKYEVREFVCVGGWGWEVVAGVRDISVDYV